MRGTLTGPLAALAPLAELAPLAFAPAAYLAPSPSAPVPYIPIFVTRVGRRTHRKTVQRVDELKYEVCCH